MHQFIKRAMNRNGKSGFTILEVLIVIVVLAVLAAIVLPKFMDTGKRSKESALKSELKIVRNAVGLFKADTGYYPKSLSDLTAATAPTAANAIGLDETGAEQKYITTDWHGPYLQELPKDPITGNHFIYSTKSGSVGRVTSSSTSSSLNGTSYNTW